MADGTTPTGDLDALVSLKAHVVLSHHASRLYEAIAILEMASDVLTVGLDDERDRRCAANHAALPKEIGCRVSLQHAVERMEAEQEAENG